MADSLRGHPIHLNEQGQWVFSDTLENTVDTYTERPCKECGLKWNSDGHAPCIRNLKGGVINACCGHGQVEEAYIMFSEGEILSGQEALDKIKELKQES